MPNPNTLTHLPKSSSSSSLTRSPSSSLFLLNLLKPPHPPASSPFSLTPPHSYPHLISLPPRPRPLFFSNRRRPLFSFAQDSSVSSNPNYILLPFYHPHHHYYYSPNPLRMLIFFFFLLIFDFMLSFR